MHNVCTLYLGSLVCDTLQYPLNGRDVEVDIVRQVKLLDSQGVLNVVRVPLKSKQNNKRNANIFQ